MFFSGKAAGVSRIIVFLGNPGPKYAGTRHNVGFAVADEIGKKLDLRINKLRFRALTAMCEFGGEKVLLLKPQTYMNLSGRSVAAALCYYKLPADRIIAVSDDTALPVGKLRIRTKGSSGGHKGLKSIISVLKSEDFPRVKIGVGSPGLPEYDLADWVLGSFDDRDSAVISEIIKKAVEATEAYIRDGAEAAMSRYNGGE
ncbi:MAG: aminoacyl-tRNA hydrolase [Oscillospiraceae bacterium]|nr:aminoacyl-tRNA hydrolase [Oscillospiraceae bacterium]